MKRFCLQFPSFAQSAKVLARFYLFYIYVEKLLFKHNDDTIKRRKRQKIVCQIQFPKLSLQNLGFVTVKIWCFCHLEILSWNAYLHPKIFSFFSYDPQTWYVIVETRNPKGHVRGWKHVVWERERERESIMHRRGGSEKLTLWCLGYSCHMGAAVKILCQTELSCHLLFLTSGHLTLSPERQSARISKITNDGLTRSGTGCFIAVPIWQQWVSNG